MPRRRRKIHQQRAYADRKYVVTLDMRKIHPTDIPNLPDKRVNGKYAPKEPRDPSSEIEELLGWWSEEDEARFLREAQRVLPRRQFQVLERGFRGLGDAEIAHDLGIRETTVRDHRALAKRNEALRSLVKKWTG